MHINYPLILKIFAIIIVICYVCKIWFHIDGRHIIKYMLSGKYNWLFHFISDDCFNDCLKRNCREYDFLTHLNNKSEKILLKKYNSTFAKAYYNIALFCEMEQLFYIIEKDVAKILVEDLQNTNASFTEKYLFHIYHVNSVKKEYMFLHLLNTCHLNQNNINKLFVIFARLKSVNIMKWIINKTKSNQEITEYIFEYLFYNYNSKFINKMHKFSFPLCSEKCVQRFISLQVSNTTSLCNPVNKISDSHFNKKLKAFLKITNSKEIIYYSFLFYNLSIKTIEILVDNTNINIYGKYNKFNVSKTKIDFLTKKYTNKYVHSVF